MRDMCWNAVFMRVCGLFCRAKIFREWSSFFNFGATYGVNPPAETLCISPRGIISHNNDYTLFCSTKHAPKVTEYAYFSRFHAPLPRSDANKPDFDNIPLSLTHDRSVRERRTSVRLSQTRRRGGLTLYTFQLFVYTYLRKCPKSCLAIHTDRTCLDIYRKVYNNAPFV